MAQCSLLGFSWDGKFRGIFPGDIFQEEVSLNHLNHSTTEKTFNIVKTHSTLQVQTIQVSTNLLHIDM